MIDLHIHTTNSDGRLTEIGILKKAQELGLFAVSITDHNTCTAYKKLKTVDVKSIYRGELVSGCEFSTIVNNVPIELLGYDIDTDFIQDNIGKLYLPFRDLNVYETNLLIEKCIELGLTIDREAIRYDEEKEYGNRGVHREIVKHEENKRFLDERSWEDPHYFSVNFIGNPSTPFFIDTSNLIPDYRVVVKFIRAAGGKVFIPHVFKYKEKSLEVLNTLINEGCLDGIECYHSTYTNHEMEFLKNLCRQKRFYMSGGTDTHGREDIVLGYGDGSMRIPDEILLDWHKVPKKLSKENDDDIYRE